VNLHASLLPHYRGAAPINHAIINGETESGVTTFLLQHEIDTGHILFAESVPIDQEDTAGDLHDRLMAVGAKLLVRTVNAIASGTVKPIPQTQLSGCIELRHAPKIFKEDCLIDWHRPVVAVHNLIRGLSPYPTAYTLLGGKTLKVFEAEKTATVPQHKPGTPYSDGKSFLKFACVDGYITVKTL